VLVRAIDLTPPRRNTLEVRGEGIWAELVCETPLEHWSIGLEAFGVHLDHPHDALTGEKGHRIAVGLDLEWETIGPPTDTPRGYAQPGTVHGDLLLGTETIPIDALGVRSHEWGSPPTHRARAFAIEPTTHALVEADTQHETPDITLLVDEATAVHRAITELRSPSGTSLRGWAEWHDPL
jgi:hypothetical protein